MDALSPPPQVPRPPPYLAAAALLLWGWQTGLLPFALPMALALEALPRVRWRWDFSDREFNRLSDLTSLMLIGVTIYVFLRDGPAGLFTLVSWLPLIYFPLLGVQLYCRAGDIALSSLFLSLRGAGNPAGLVRVDLTYPYLLLLLIAAAMKPGAEVFWGSLLLIAWGLWGMRPKRYSAILWLVLMALAATGAYATQMGIERLQEAMEEWVVEWMSGWYLEYDPYRRTTAIGDIGELKLSERILLRVDVPEGLPAGGLRLRQASYDQYDGGTWRALRSDFRALTPLREGGPWPLGPADPVGDRLTIATRLPQGQGMLALPGGTHLIEDLPAIRIEHNRQGAIKVVEGPGYVSYTARTGSGTPRDGPPTESDLKIPERERPALAALAQELALGSLPPQAAVDAVRGHFAQGFGYTLVLDAPADPGVSPLARFLTQSRSGHCEYYASATVLLLRAGGIPARYASGYSVQEYSPLEGSHVVRARHAHAWALAHLGDRWIDVDTTPPQWVAAEAARRPWWQAVPDLGAWVADRFERWRWRRTEGDATDWLAWLLLPLGLLLAWRLMRRERVREAPGEGARTSPMAVDSPFYAVVDGLVAAGYARAPGEPLGAWLDRTRPPGLVLLRDMLRLHQRLRFDPRGLDAASRERLAALAGAWTVGP